MTQKPGGNLICSPLSPPYHYSDESERDWLIRCTDWAERVLTGSGKWWLVEAHDADTARSVIDLHEDCIVFPKSIEAWSKMASPFRTKSPGRVLAYGGRS